MKIKSYILGVAMLLLFAIGVPVANAQGSGDVAYLTNTQVNEQYYALMNMGRGIPEFIQSAMSVGSGVYLVSDGYYRLDNELVNTCPANWAPGVFADVLSRTGDPYLAELAAIEYWLTHDEWGEINNPPDPNYGYLALNWMPSWFKDYSSFGDGGGGYQNPE
jgi:hypothetical protein